MGTRGRVAAVAVAVVAAVALFVFLRGMSDDVSEQGAAPDAAQSSTTAETTEPGATETQPSPPPPPPPGPRQIVLRIPEGGPTGIQRVRIQQGEEVVLVIRSAVADHAHLHGYDLLADVAPGRVARIRFEATTPGRFEIELEDRGEPFAELTVAP